MPLADARSPRRRSAVPGKKPSASCAGCSAPSIPASTSTRTGSPFGGGWQPGSPRFRRKSRCGHMSAMVRSSTTFSPRHSAVCNSPSSPPVHLQSAYSVWAASGRRDSKDGGLSPRTRRHIHRILSSALSRAVEQQLIPRNPSEAFKKRLPKVERSEMATLTPEQSARLLDAVRHLHVYWPVLIALATGMRRGETLALRWKNVDLDRGTVRIVESLEQKRSGLRFKAPKTEKARAITLPAFAVDELRRLKREQAESLLMLGVRQTGDTLVCARRDGDPLQPQSLTHEFPSTWLGWSPISRGSDFMICATAMTRSFCSPECIRRWLRNVSGTRRSHHPRSIQPRHGNDARGRREPSRRRFPECYKHPLRPK